MMNPKAYQNQLKAYEHFCKPNYAEVISGDISLPLDENKHEWFLDNIQYGVQDGRLKNEARNQMIREDLKTLYNLIKPSKVEYDERRRLAMVRKDKICNLFVGSNFGTVLEFNLEKRAIDNCQSEWEVVYSVSNYSLKHSQLNGWFTGYFFNNPLKASDRFIYRFSVSTQLGGKFPIDHCWFLFTDGTYATQISKYIQEFSPSSGGADMKRILPETELATNELASSSTPDLLDQPQEIEFFGDDTYVESDNLDETDDLDEVEIIQNNYAAHIMSSSCDVEQFPLRFGEVLICQRSMEVFNSSQESFFCEEKSLEEQYIDWALSDKVDFSLLDA